MAEPSKESLSYRWLGADEYEKLRDIFDARGWLLPDPQVSGIRVGETEDGIVKAFSCVQLWPFMGPIWIDPEWRGLKITEGEDEILLDAAFKSGPFAGASLTTTPDNKPVLRIAERLGFVNTGEMLFSKMK